MYSVIFEVLDVGELEAVLSGRLPAGSASFM